MAATIARMGSPVVVSSRQSPRGIDGSAEENLSISSREVSPKENPLLPQEPIPLEKNVEQEEEPMQKMEVDSKKGRKTKIKRAAVLFDHLPDMTAEATSDFSVINNCIYIPKWLGETDQEETMTCDCQPDFVDGVNMACGEGSDCINRMTGMECTGDDATCGGDCKNQRFQKREYANVSVIKTEKKGYGLRTNERLAAGSFIYEYVGEVIDEPRFRKRTQQYANEGIEHFYFMSLKSGEFVDASKKGGLGRFCNHSCSPNSMVDKWIIGEKMRMGIFAKIDIEAGEELTFDYNVDRYGAEPQICHCGEPNCIGYIGGKTQTDSDSHLPASLAEALGVDEYEWSSTIKKGKKHKKKKSEDDSDYEEDQRASILTEAGTGKVMASLLKSREKWIANRLLNRIKDCDDPKVFASAMRLHGYQIFGAVLNRWSNDSDVAMSCLYVLECLPAITRNKIVNTKIETTVQAMQAHQSEEVREQAEKLVSKWSKLELGYRIPRKPKEERSPSEDKSTPKPKIEETTVAPKRPTTPIGPRSSVPNFQKRQFFHNTNNRHQQQRKEREPADSAGNKLSKFPVLQCSAKELSERLPDGWAALRPQTQGDNLIQYYNIRTRTLHPKIPNEFNRNNLPPLVGPNELKTCQQKWILYENINKVNEQEAAKAAKARAGAAAETAAQATSTSPGVKVQQVKVAKEEKPYNHKKALQKFTVALSQHVPNVVVKYQKDLGGREEVKKHAKAIAKVIIEKETRNKPVIDPILTDSRKKKIKEFTVQYIEKILKHLREKKRKAENAGTSSSSSNTASKSYRSTTPDYEPGTNPSPDEILSFTPQDTVSDVSPMDSATPNNTSPGEALSGQKAADLLEQMAAQETANDLANGSTSPKRKRSDDDDEDSNESRDHKRSRSPPIMDLPMMESVPTPSRIGSPSPKINHTDNGGDELCVTSRTLKRSRSPTPVADDLPIPSVNRSPSPKRKRRDGDDDENVYDEEEMHQSKRPRSRENSIEPPSLST